MLTELINYHRKSPKTVNLLNHGNIYNLKKKHWNLKQFEKPNSKSQTLDVDGTELNFRPRRCERLNKMESLTSRYFKVQLGDH